MLKTSQNQCHGDVHYSGILILALFSIKLHILDIQIYGHDVFLLSLCLFRFVILVNCC